jgi:CheY-like chemotaxis protein
MSSLENCRLLFVDDEEDFLASLTKYLRRKKLSVATANSGQAALDWFAENCVDIVVLDIKMPDMNGVDVLRRMRALKGDDFGVIILSGMPTRISPWRRCGPEPTIFCSSHAQWKIFWNGSICSMTGF